MKTGATSNAGARCIRAAMQKNTVTAITKRHSKPAIVLGLLTAVQLNTRLAMLMRGKPSFQAG
jgi:hypothetical protein